MHRARPPPPIDPAFHRPDAENRRTKTLKIAAIPGEGIGTAVMPEGLRVLAAAARRFNFKLDIDLVGTASTTEMGQALAALV